MAQSKSDNLVSFEDSLEELEKLVAEMEQGELPLNEALSKFERGIALAKTSQQALEKAEQRVKILMQNQDGETLEDFNANGNEETL